MSETRVSELEEQVLKDLNALGLDYAGDNVKAVYLSLAKVLITVSDCSGKNAWLTGQYHKAEADRGKEVGFAKSKASRIAGFILRHTVSKPNPRYNGGATSAEVPDDVRKELGI